MTTFGVSRTVIDEVEAWQIVAKDQDWVAYVVQDESGVFPFETDTMVSELVQDWEEDDLAQWLTDGDIVFAVYNDGYGWATVHRVVGQPNGTTDGRTPERAVAVLRLTRDAVDGFALPSSVVAERLVEAEASDYRAWLTGDVWTAVVDRHDDGEIDECSGDANSCIFGQDNAEQIARQLFAEATRKGE